MYVGCLLPTLLIWSTCNELELATFFSEELLTSEAEGEFGENLGPSSIDNDGIDLFASSCLFREGNSKDWEDDSVLSPPGGGGASMG